MAITTYGDLRTKFLKTLNRRDCSTADADNYIDQGMGRLLRLVRVASMEKTVELEVSVSGAINIPTDFIQLIRLESAGRVLTRLAAAEFLSLPEDEGDPLFYIREASLFLLRPNPGAEGTVKVVYYADVFPFDDPSDTDPIIDAASDAVLAAAMTFACSDFNDEREDRFERKFQTAVGEIRELIAMQEAYEGPQAIAPSSSCEY